MYTSQYRNAGRRKGTKVTERAMNAACHGNISACHLGHACHRFATFVLRIQPLKSAPFF